MKRRLRPGTVVVEAGRPVRTPGAPVNSPIVMSSTYVGHERPAAGELIYARLGTESWEPLEDALGQLENAGRPGLLFASGMAAISAVLDLAPVGGAVVAPRHAYHESLVALKHLADRSAVRPRLVDIADTAAVVAAITGAGISADETGADDGAATDPGGPAALVWLETPTNPMLEIADIAAITQAAHAVGALVVVDNTFATPLAQRPLELDVDVVVHSVTKYLAGHSDVILGAVVARDGQLLARVRQRRVTAGGVAGPFEAWLALRGLRTLALRVERSQANALELARRLQSHPAVLAVSHPGLPEHPQHELATRQMDGYGSILTLRVHGGAEAAARLTSEVRLWLPATSLGGVESMLERRRRWPNEAPTVPDDLLRVSVGIEDVEDLWEDLDRALTASQG